MITAYLTILLATGIPILLSASYIRAAGKAWHRQIDADESAECTCGQCPEP